MAVLPRNAANDIFSRELQSPSIPLSLFVRAIMQDFDGDRLVLQCFLSLVGFCDTVHGSYVRLIKLNNYLWPIKIASSVRSSLQKKANNEFQNYVPTGVYKV